jgi:hypothetical protein
MKEITGKCRPRIKTQVSVFIDPELRDRLRTAARRNVRSVSNEAAVRLHRSFECDDGWQDWPPHVDGTSS